MKIISHNQFDLAEFALQQLRKLIGKIEIYQFLKDKKRWIFLKHHMYHRDGKKRHSCADNLIQPKFDTYSCKYLLKRIVQKAQHQISMKIKTQPSIL